MLRQFFTHATGAQLPCPRQSLLQSAYQDSDEDGNFHWRLISKEYSLVKQDHRFHAIHMLALISAASH